MDETHFDDIKYLLEFSYAWYLWYMHDEYVDSPYTLNEVYNYEFTASGGG